MTKDKIVLGEVEYVNNGFATLKKVHKGFKGTSFILERCARIGYERLGSDKVRVVVEKIV